MKKKKTEKLLKDVDIVESIFCNKCGKEFIQKQWIGRVHEISIDFSHYFSRFDSQKWSFDLCEECIFDIVKSFKHFPDGYDGFYSEQKEYKQTKGQQNESELQKQDTNEKKNDLFEVLNDLSVIDIGSSGDEIEYVLIEQSNEVCVLLEKIKPKDWEEYLENHSDGEFVDIAPLAWELGANHYDKTTGFSNKL